MSAEGTVVQAEPYHVEARGGCGTCGAGRLFDVVGPDGVADGISFDHEVDAEEYAGALSGAYWQGHAAGLQEGLIQRNTVDALLTPRLLSLLGRAWDAIRPEIPLDEVVDCTHCHLPRGHAPDCLLIRIPELFEQLGHREIPS